MGQLEPAVICRVTSDEATLDDIKKSVVTYEDAVSDRSSRPANDFLTVVPLLSVRVITDPQPGDVVDERFAILELIDRGGMGSVFKAIDAGNGRPVALKFPFFALESDPAFYSRFQREIDIGKALDLKPTNIMLCRDGSLRIMDFGIAMSASARRLTFAGLRAGLGTVHYMAPEQVRGSAATSGPTFTASGPTCMR
jgi:serine/threonine protein kinase